MGMCSDEMQLMVRIVAKLLDIVRFIVPIVLIIFCTVDIFKIIVSKKEDEIKKLRNDVFAKILYAIMIYLVPFLIPFIFSMADKILPMEYDNSWQECYELVKKNDKIEKNT